MTQSRTAVLVILFSLLAIRQLNKWGITSPTDQLRTEKIVSCSSVNPSVCEIRNKRTEILEGKVKFLRDRVHSDSFPFMRLHFLTERRCSRCGS